MFCGAGIELIKTECVFTLLNGNSIEFCGDNDSATHAAVRAIAASCGTETVAEPDREADGAAVAGRFGLGDIREHGNTFVEEVAPRGWSQPMERVKGRRSNRPRTRAVVSAALSSAYGKRYPKRYLSKISAERGWCRRRIALKGQQHDFPRPPRGENF